jgi:putative SOS response-associated peptidase YedK
MCGAFLITLNPATDALAESLSVGYFESRGIRTPASMIQMVTEDAHDRYLEDAKWWLLLDKTGKPNYQYATFNSRSDKLYSSSLTKPAFATSRCLIPASGIIEGQNKKYHYITSENNALLLGGIYKQYQIGDELITTASIITCPGNPKLEHIHRKSIPLMFDPNDSSLIDMWLDPSMNEPEAFRHILTNELKFDLLATPTVGARDLEATGETLHLKAD